MKKFFFGHGILVLAAIAGFGAVVMLLWNALVPTIFGLAVINFWQALGLLVLARLFFGGFRGFRGIGGFAHRHEGGFGKNPLREKWEQMTPEQRAMFLRNRRKRFGHDFEHDFGDDFAAWHDREFANDESKNDESKSNNRRD
jgi:hypothetical protein